MKKSALLIIVGIGIVGSGLFVAGAVLDGNPFVRLSFGGHYEENEAELTDLDSFDRIELSTIAGEVNLSYGDEFSVEYKLSSQEKIERVEVDNGTLYFEVNDNVFSPDNIGIGVNFNIAETGGYINITVPKGTEFTSINCSNVSGDMEIFGTIEELGLNTVSGELEVGDAESSFDTVVLNSVSGDCMLEGTLAKEAEMNTVSGDIELELQGNSVSIKANTFGDVSVNGDEKSATYQSDEGDTQLNLNSVSGDISIKTK